MNTKHFQEIKPELAQQFQTLDALVTRHEAFWVERLATLQPITIPYTKRTGSSPKQKQFARAKVPISNKVITFLAEHHSDWNLGNFILAAFVTYLARLERNQYFDIGFSDVELKRKILGLENLFASHVPCRIEVGDGQSFEDVFYSVQEQVELTKSHLTYAHDVVTRYPALNSLLQPGHEQMLSVLVERVEKLEDDPAVFSHELTLVIPSDGKNCCCFYNTETFEGGSLDIMLEQLATFMQGIVMEPTAPVTHLQLLTEQERHKILVKWNDTVADYPKQVCIHQLFEAQVKKTPDAIAVVFEEQRLTYGELNRKANQVAHHLQALGVEAGMLVGLCVERSLETIVGLLGILKSGGAYVPLDPTYPQERLAFMLEDSQVSVLLSIKTSVPALPECKAHMVCLDTDWRVISQHSQINPVSNTTATHLAYVIYTSGSTGRPKGVEVAHRSVVHLFAVTQPLLNFGDLDVWTVFHSCAFDFSVWEIWGALLSGSKLVVVPTWMTQSPQAFYDLLIREKVTILNQTPSVIAQLMPIHKETDRNALKLRLIVCGGEVLPSQLAFQVLKWNVALWNFYGPTEATVWTLINQIQSIDPKERSIPIGKPLANVQVYILDRYLQPVPIGVPGELYIGGNGLAIGYHNRPDLTHSKFISNPFYQAQEDEQAAVSSNDRLYKTGDIARYLPNGNIEFLGRIDNQVKIRGFRIELGEIEFVLETHPKIQQAVVIDREDIPGNKQLVAYLLTGELSVSPNELRSFLKQQLPEYMVPSAFVMLDALPLTSNRKVDRRALPAPTLLRTQEVAFVAPHTQSEKTIATIWSEVLGFEAGVEDNFLELGGHSLLAIQIISRINDRLQVKLPLSSLFEYPTIKELARFVEGLDQSELGFLSTPIQRISQKQNLPLSFTQEQYWFISQLHPDEPIYNETIAIHINENINPTFLEQSLTALVQRHEILRTSFVAFDGKPVQNIHAPFSVDLSVIDLRAETETERETKALQLATQELKKLFNLSQCPLWRATLIQLGETNYRLFIAVHHLLVDGISIVNIFPSELKTLYTAFSQGKSSLLPEPTLQYADFAFWQRQGLQEEEVFSTQLAYWKQKLANLPILQLPTDRPRQTKASFQGARQCLALSKSLTEQLKTLSRQKGVTLFITLMAAVNTLLYRYSGQEDIVLGTVTNDRNRSELEGVMGNFLNTLVLRTYLGGNPSFQQMLQQVQKVMLEAYAHQDVPFEKLVAALQPDRRLAENPLFQVMFILEPLVEPDIAWTFSQLDVHSETAKLDLTFELDERPEGIIGRIEYSTALFDDATITRMIDHLQTLLEGIVANPEQQISKLPLLTDAEQQQLLVEWNNTTADYPKQLCIHQLFEAQVEQTPDAVAVVFEDEMLTYRELNSRANQLAHYLRSVGVGAEVLVGLCVERSIKMVVGLLGILKAGGAYIPLDPAYPTERIDFILSDAQVSVLLTDSSFFQKEEEQYQVICLDTDTENINSQSAVNPVPSATAENLAYVIYTSGSTGKPKGVQIQHTAVVNLLISMQRQPGLTAKDVLLAVTTITFDIAALELYLPLITGARIVLVRPEVAKDGNLLRAQIAAAGATIMQGTPATFRMLLAAGLSDLRGVKILCGGEALPSDLMQQLLETGAGIWNMYGPTETTVWSTVFFGAMQSSYSTIPIGRPIANTEIYLLDDHLQPVPIGVPGELHIGGVGLARGYVNLRELTTEKFIPHPFSSVPGARLYKTGDLARYLKDGNIEYLGRIDHQVKIRGFRIELGEIEAAIAQHKDVGETVVIVREDVSSDKRLVAYIVPHQLGTAPTNTELRSFLKQKLPDYMVPGAFVMLSALPLTPNGKVDRRSLPVPSGQVELSNSFVVPRTPIEQMLAEIWAGVLRVEQVGIHDNFFELGGDSILAFQIVARANTAGLGLSVKQLFKYKTIAELAAKAGTIATGQVQQGLVTGTLPLTPIQHWFFEQNFSSPEHRNQAFLVEIPAHIASPILEQVLQQLLAHHDALRLRFEKNNGGWQQINAGVDHTIDLSAIDLSALPPAQHKAAIENVAASVQGSLNLKVEPLLRVVMFTLGKHLPSQLLVIIHDLVVDSFSWRILLEDLQTAYQQLKSGSVIELPAKTTAFKYWAQKLSEYAQSTTLEKELAYWLSECYEHVATIPIDYPEGANTEASARTVSVSLSVEETTVLLQEVPKAYNTQINDVLLTALVQVLAQWAESNYILFNLKGHGREEIFKNLDLSRTVGCFTTIFPVLLQLKKATDNLENTLISIKEQLRQIPNHGIGYGLLRYLKGDTVIAAKLAALPQAQIIFNYLGELDQITESLEPVHSLKNNRSHLLDIDGLVVEGRLQLHWTYSKNMHQHSTIESLTQKFLAMLQALIAHCLSDEAGGFSPSDFPEANLTQESIEQFLAKLNQRSQ